MSRIARWGDLASADLQDLLSWSGERVGNVQMRFRGEVLGSRALRNPVIRGCPICLRQDAETHDGDPAEAMAMRGDWQLREATLCLKHQHPLVSLWRVDRLPDRYDVGARLKEVEDDLIRGALDRPREDASAYDLWLDARLEHRGDTTWLAGQSLYSATTVSRLLGTELAKFKYDKTLSADEQHRRALGDGFEALRGGEAAFKEALDRLAASASGPLDKPAKAFGELFRKMSRDFVADDTFAVFRGILRECILSHWPYASGDILLGEKVKERRLHSVVTAARQVELWPAGLDAMLAEAGVLAKEDQRPYSRKVFDAIQHVDLLSEIPSLVGPGEMQTAMGATKAALISLEEGGVLIPRTRAPKIIARWRISDGIGLVEEIAALAIPMPENQLSWETLQQARRRKGLDVGTIIRLVRSGALKIAASDVSAGYSGFSVLKAGINAIVAGRASVTPQFPELSDTISAAAFGRSIGPRDGRRFLALVEAGYVPATELINPKTQKKQLRMNDQDIAAFHRQFLTLTTAEVEFGISRNRASAIVKAHDAKPFSPEGQDFGSIWLRVDVAPLFASGSR
ncbi:TniQ family protein [uncultured Sulfitobacter sp.]|uniref:TniQ family protein n=1 Tax=uncultured Sulfitobacter sp. TaxID=191468 RepID=UPI002622DEF4|nr:TniQ family protein [uncultured Sulfitobacter sp.]